jgi:hypothetical protein
MLFKPLPRTDHRLYRVYELRTIIYNPRRCVDLIHEAKEAEDCGSFKLFNKRVSISDDYYAYN